MKVHVKWKDNGAEFEEVVTLISEEKGQLLLSDGTPAPISVSDLIVISGLVLFEDDTGVFGLEPNTIVSVEVVS